MILVIAQVSCMPRMDSRQKFFSLLPPEETGVSFENRLVETEDMNIIEYLYFNNGAGVAAGDIDNDGLIDLYFTASQGDNKLYLNQGDFQFKDITGTAGVSGTGDWKTGVTMADVNGDGFLDIYVCQVSEYKGLKGGNQLFINNGDLTFSDRTREYGLDFQGFSTQSVFLDFDLDGDLDMFLLNHSVHSVRSYGEIGLREEFDPRAGDRLFRNDLMEGRTGFTDITRQSGIYSSQIGYGLNVSAGDLNNDGYPDLYISNDFHENDYLYINDGDGTFTDRFTEMMAYSSRSSMGNDIGDFNNDGLLDLIVLDMLPAVDSIRQRSGGEDDLDVYQIKRSYGYHHQFVRNTLQLNLGGDIFSEIGRFAGVHATDWSWSPLWCDLDNDGWKDLFITNGIFRRPNDLDYIRFLTGARNQASLQNIPPPDDKVLYEKMPLDKLVNYAFRNNRDLTFTNQALEWGLNIPSFSNGSAYADLDNDGDLDLVVNNINDPAFIFRNNVRNKAGGRNFISIRLKGKEANTFGIGTRVIIYHNGDIQMAENFLTRGFFSSMPPQIHFGLDSISVIDSMEIRWPGNRVSRLYEVPANQHLELNISGMETDEVNRKAKVSAGSAANAPLRKVNGIIPEIRHRENRFNDFAYEKLIPHQLSMEGPCIAVGDVNGDKLDDLYIGGAAGQSGSLL
ncbi:MAG: CRTAC1 family protein, partial [Cyclobacteriaceae bacterium]|nr:CRTAC1 family protein [Cyclobacteriaceae bacterium]